MTSLLKLQLFRFLHASHMAYKAIGNTSISKDATQLRAKDELSKTIGIRASGQMRRGWRARGAPPFPEAQGRTGSVPPLRWSAQR